MIDLHKKLNASITVEAAIGFTLTIFILFLLLGPLFIIKTSSDILIKLNSASKLRCKYEMIKDSFKDTRIGLDIKSYLDEYSIPGDKFQNLENIINFGLMSLDFANEYDESKREYRNISYVYNKNAEVYLEDTNEVLYDFVVGFKLPYNLLHIEDIRKRLVNNRRAFVGAPPNRFSNLDESGEFAYVANNHINSSIYHLFIDCTYLIKKTETVSYKNIPSKRNDSNKKYTKCDYCFRDVRLNDDTACYITQYGDKFHYRDNCPVMTAYVTKIPKESIENYNLVLCSRCSKRENK